MSMTAADKKELGGLFEDVAINALQPVNAALRAVNAALRAVEERMAEVEVLRMELDQDIRAVRAAANLREAIRQMVATEKESRS